MQGHKVYNAGMQENATMHFRKACAQCVTWRISHLVACLGLGTISGEEWMPLFCILNCMTFSICTSDGWVLFKSFFLCFLAVFKKSLLILIILIEMLLIIWPRLFFSVTSSFLAGRILGRNPDKCLKSFSPCYSHSPHQFYFLKLTQPLAVSTIHCKGERRKTW